MIRKVISGGQTGADQGATRALSKAQDSQESPLEALRQWAG
jgi:hypothetical protein